MSNLTFQEYLAVLNTIIAISNLIVAICNYRLKVKLNKRDALED